MKIKLMSFFALIMVASFFFQKDNLTTINKKVLATGGVEIGPICAAVNRDICLVDQECGIILFGVRVAEPQ